VLPEIVHKPRQQVQGTLTHALTPHASNFPLTGVGRRCPPCTPCVSLPATAPCLGVFSSQPSCRPHFAWCGAAFNAGTPCRTLLCGNKLARSAGRPAIYLAPVPAWPAAALWRLHAQSSACPLAAGPRGRVAQQVPQDGCWRCCKQPQRQWPWWRRGWSRHAYGGPGCLCARLPSSGSTVRCACAGGVCCFALRLRVKWPKCSAWSDPIRIHQNSRASQNSLIPYKVLPLLIATGSQDQWYRAELSCIKGGSQAQHTAIWVTCAIRLQLSLCYIVDACIYFDQVHVPKEVCMQLLRPLRLLQQVPIGFPNCFG